jgi:hypothetical protein
MSGSSYTNVFGGSVVRPADPSYLSLSISTDTTLVWPLETTEGEPVVANAIDVTATTTSLSLTMPTGNTGSTGVVTMITNVGSNSFSVRTSTSVLIATIATTQSWLIKLTDNSTAAGTWQALQMASTTSSASAASLAGAGLEANGSLLQVDFPTSYLSTNTNLTTAYRGRAVVWTGGVGTLQLANYTVLGDGWFCWITNTGSGTLTITTTGGQTINGAATLVMNAGNSGVIIAGASGFASYGALVDALAIVNGGTGATDANSALTNLGGTSIGKSIFTAPSSAAVLAILGITNLTLTESTVAVNQSPNAGAGNTVFVATAVLSINLPLSTTLTTGYVLGVRATGGAVTLVPAATDDIDASGVGLSYTIPDGGSTYIFTDANGKWWLLSGPAMRGTTLTTTGTASFGGAVTMASTANVAGNFSVATTKFTVAAATGNTQVGGTFNVLDDTVLGGDLFINGQITMSGTTGNITTTGKITATGAVTFLSTGAFTSTVTAADGTSGNQVVNYSQFPQTTTASTSIGFPGAVGGGVGIYDQSGTGTTSVLGFSAAVFPVTFPTACKSVVITPFDAGGVPYFVTITAVSASQVNLQIRDIAGTGTSGIAFYWRATGY